MTVNRNLVSGNTSMLLLRLLSEKDMYGYEMIDTLSKRSNNIFELKVGSLYPLLHSLVKEGYLKSFDEQANGKLRKYYQITESGERYLGKLIEEWAVHADAVDMMIGRRMRSEC